MDSVASAQGWKAWLPAASLGFAAFIFVTTELIPVGLLPDIATGLGQSQAVTGLLVTAYAWMVALMSLPLTVMSARFDRRSLLLWLLAAFAASHVLAAAAQSFTMLLLARVCIALSHAIFWAITTPLVMRVAPQGKKAQALGVIVTGVSLATVLGVPLGTMLGQALGWRAAFIAIGAIALGILLLIRRLLPPLPSSNAGSLRSVPGLLRRASLMKIYALTLLTVTGHFAAFTYLTPFLAQQGGFSPRFVVFFLLLLGGSGILGSILSSRYTEKYPRATLLLPLLLLCACLALLRFTDGDFYRVALLCIAWGASMPAVCLVFQTRVLNLAPDAADVAVSIYSGTFNIGIGGGALLGSRVYADLGLNAVGYAGALFMAGAVLVCALPWIIRKSPSSS